MSPGEPGVRALPAGPVWFLQSTSNGGAHYGELRPDGQVRARCGAVFTPETHPFGTGPVWWHKPVDPEHACLRCREHG